MALDVWFREDVARILTATQETLRGFADFRSDSMPAADAPAAEATQAYQQGFGDALRAIALAFGVAAGAGRAGGGEMGWGAQPEGAAAWAVCRALPPRRSGLADPEGGRP
jgi:hypothetical protein